MLGRVLAMLVSSVGDSVNTPKTPSLAARKPDLDPSPPKYEVRHVGESFIVLRTRPSIFGYNRRVWDWSNRKYRKLRNGRGMCKFVEIQNGPRHVNASRQSLPTWRRIATTTTGETLTAAMDLKHLAVRAARYGTSCSSKVGTPSISVTKRCIWTDHDIDCLFLLLASSTCTGK